MTVSGWMTFPSRRSGWLSGKSCLEYSLVADGDTARRRPARCARPRTPAVRAQGPGPASRPRAGRPGPARPRRPARRAVRDSSRSVASAAPARSSTAACPSVSPNLPASRFAIGDLALLAVPEVADELLQGRLVLGPDPADRRGQRHRVEQPRARALPPVLHVGAVGDEHEGQGQQDVPLPPRQVPVVVRTCPATIASASSAYAVTRLISMAAGRLRWSWNIMMAAATYRATPTSSNPPRPAPCGRRLAAQRGQARHEGGESPGGEQDGRARRSATPAISARPGPPARSAAAPRRTRTPRRRAGRPAGPGRTRSSVRPRMTFGVARPCSRKNPALPRNTSETRNSRASARRVDAWLIMAAQDHVDPGHGDDQPEVAGIVAAT